MAAIFLFGDDEVSSDCMWMWRPWRAQCVWNGTKEIKYYVIGTTKFDVRRIGQWESIENVRAVTRVSCVFPFG